MLSQLQETKLQRAKCVGDQESPHLARGGYGFSPQHFREEVGGREEDRRKRQRKMSDQKPGMVEHIFNPSAHETEADRSLSSRPSYSVSS